MNGIYELKETLQKELDEYGNKDLTSGSLDAIDKLSRSVKNLGKIIDKYEESEYSYDNGMNYGDYSNARNGRRSSRYSGARRRDSMGRYSSRRGYSMDNKEMISELRELMQDAPDDRTRQEFQSFIDKMERM